MSRRILGLHDAIDETLEVAWEYLSSPKRTGTFVRSEPLSHNYSPTTLTSIAELPLNMIVLISSAKIALDFIKYILASQKDSQPA